MISVNVGDVLILITLSLKKCTCKYVLFLFEGDMLRVIINFHNIKFFNASFICEHNCTVSWDTYV